MSEKFDTKNITPIEQVWKQPDSLVTEDGATSLATVSLLRNKHTRTSQLFLEGRMTSYNALDPDDEFHLTNYLFSIKDRGDGKEIQYLYDLAINCLTNQEQPLSWKETLAVLKSCEQHLSIETVEFRPIDANHAQTPSELLDEIY